MIDREERPDFTLERVAFNTAPWSRVNGYFLLPANVDLPVPGLVVFHAWGGPMLFGKERIVDTGRDHALLAQHRDQYEVVALSSHPSVSIPIHVLTGRPS